MTSQTQPQNVPLALDPIHISAVAHFQLLLARGRDAQLLANLSDHSGLDLPMSRDETPLSGEPVDDPGMIAPFTDELAGIFPQVTH
jgi:hypothetical protein